MIYNQKGRIRLRYIDFQHQSPYPSAIHEERIQLRRHRQSRERTCSTFAQLLATWWRLGCNHLTTSLHRNSHKAISKPRNSNQVKKEVNKENSFTTIYVCSEPRLGGGGSTFWDKKIMKNAILQKPPYFNHKPATRNHAPY